MKDYFNNQMDQEQLKNFKIKEYIENNLSCLDDNADLIEIDDNLFICSKCKTYYYYENNKLNKCEVK